MNNKLVIFGLGDMAELARYFFESDSPYTVVAFTVDREYISQDTYCGLPVVPFDEVHLSYPPQECDMFVALAYSKLNLLRMQKYEAAKALRYNLATYLSSKATVLTDVIGDNCFVFEDNTIQPFVSIGSNVTLWSGNHIGHHSMIGDHVFIASHAVISGHVTIGERCFIGVNATLRDHIVIGPRCVIGAGTLLLSDAEPDGLYIGTATVRAERPSTSLRRI